MADGSTIITSPGLKRARPTLRDGVGDDRHIVARCFAPDCGRDAPCDSRPWLAEGLGDLPLDAFSTRVRCVCGARKAGLEVRPGPFAPAARPDLFIFR
jgi:hypothetical protein